MLWPLLPQILSDNVTRYLDPLLETRSGFGSLEISSFSLSKKSNPKEVSLEEEAEQVFKSFELVCFTPIQSTFGRTDALVGA